jgi:hypothetical protein
MGNPEKNRERHKHDIGEELYTDNRLQMLGVVNDFNDGFHNVSFCPYLRATLMPAGRRPDKNYLESITCVGGDLHLRVGLRKSDFSYALILGEKVE